MMDSNVRADFSARALRCTLVAIVLAVFVFGDLALVHAGGTRTITTYSHSYSSSSSFQFDIEEDDSSRSSCNRGYGLCEGKCVPVGSVCCRGGEYCPHANICTLDHHCLPSSSPRVCSGGTYCDPGFHCGPGNSCISEEAEREKEVERIMRDGQTEIERIDRDHRAAMDKINRDSRDKAEQDKADRLQAGKLNSDSDRMIEQLERRQEASRDETSPTPPPPTVVVQGMQTNQQSSNTGSNGNVPTPCQDLTGVSGCQNGGASPKVQAQINQAQAAMQQANQIRRVDPSYDGKRQAVENLFKAAAAFQAAGDLVRAAEAAEQAQPLVDELKDDHASNAGPPFAPADFWIGTPYAEYCANANSVERGSAYYGSVCYPDNRNPAPTTPERTTLCAQRLKMFKSNSPSDAWLAGEMAKRPLDCNVDGSPMTFRQVLQWRTAHPDPKM
jgi:hypothetical protein